MQKPQLRLIKYMKYTSYFKRHSQLRDGCLFYQHVTSVPSVFTDLLSSADFPLVPLYHNRGLDGINGFHRCQMHSTWFTHQQTTVKVELCSTTHTVIIWKGHFSRRKNISSPSLRLICTDSPTRSLDRLLSILFCCNEKSKFR